MSTYQQFLNKQDEQFAELEQYATQSGHEALLVEAVGSLVEAVAADDAAMTKDEQRTLARRVLAATTQAYLQGGFPPEATWAGMVEG